MGIMKIWGFRCAGLGDMVASLPLLTYMEKWHPGSYKYWSILKKCSQAAPMFMNHPLIDKIVISSEWENESSEFIDLKNSCDVIVDDRSPHYKRDWWANGENQIDLHFKSAGIFDHHDVLSEEELLPKLYKWWTNPSDVKGPNTGYSQRFTKLGDQSKRIAIVPFAHYGQHPGRYPGRDWWQVVVEMLIEEGYEVLHLGWINDPVIVGTTRLVDEDYFTQIKHALDTKLVISSDAGTAWYIAAFGHPMITVMTYWSPGHLENPMAYCPPNPNVTQLFDPTACERIHPTTVVDTAKAMI